MEFVAEETVEILEELGDYEGSFVLAEDGVHSGSFIFARLLLQALRTKGDDLTEIVMVSTAHSLEHYESLLRRNSLDVRLEALAKRVTMRFLVPEGSLAGDMGVVGKEEKVRVETANAYYSCRHCEWGELHEWVHGELIGKSKTGNRRSMLFVDDINLFESLAPSKEAARKLLFSILHNLKHSDLAASGVSTFIAAAPIEVFPDEAISLEDGEEPTLAEVAKYHANVMITTLPLSTGYSSEVHGLVKYTACRGGQALKENFAFKVQSANSVSFVRLQKEGDV